LDQQNQEYDTNKNSIESDQKKLIICLEDMMVNCAPDGYFKEYKPSLK